MGYDVSFSSASGVLCLIYSFLVHPAGKSNGKPLCFMFMCIILHRVCFAVNKAFCLHLVRGLGQGQNHGQERHVHD